jgi:hypothetical protein
VPDDDLFAPEEQQPAHHEVGQDQRDRRAIDPRDAPRAFRVDRIDEARKDARADNDALKEKVNSIVTGGINAKVAGFVFVAFGVVLANMSEEIASWWLAAF